MLKEIQKRSFLTIYLCGTLEGCRERLEILMGFSIYNKILDKTLLTIRNKPFMRVRIYCFLDRESRDHNPPLIISTLIILLRNPELRESVLSADLILATQMIESWFFYDIDGIYRFLKTPLHHRNPKKYRPVERYSANDLSRLFIQNGKAYIKGRRCHNFVNHLSLEKYLTHAMSLIEELI